LKKGVWIRQEKRRNLPVFCGVYVDFNEPKIIKDQVSLWKNPEASKLIKPYFEDWRGGIKRYLKFPGCGHFTRQIREKSRKKWEKFLQTGKNAGIWENREL